MATPVRRCKSKSVTRTCPSGHSGWHQKVFCNIKSGRILFPNFGFQQRLKNWGFGFHPFNTCLRRYCCLYGCMWDKMEWTHLWSLPMGMQESFHTFFKEKYASPMMKSNCTKFPLDARRHVQLHVRVAIHPCWKWKMCFVTSNVSTLCLWHSFVPCQRAAALLGHPTPATQR